MSESEAERVWLRWAETHAQGFDAAHVAFLAGFEAGEKGAFEAGFNRGLKEKGGEYAEGWEEKP